MSDMNQTPAASRIQIGFFGQRNVGKSSVVNAVSGQQISIVSDTKGTTTDPVGKAMELLPLGPVLLIDTPGYDDEGELGQLRVRRTLQVLDKVDLAVLVADCSAGLQPSDGELLAIFREKELPYLIVWNKSDLCESIPPEKGHEIRVSAKTGQGIHELKEKLAHLTPEENSRRIVGDLLSPGDLVVLVTPIDEAAPKGRLILPQQQTIRDILDADACSIVTKETALPDLFTRLNQKPALVITDSQAFGIVAELTPKEIPLTSFSILMARYKGQLYEAVKAAAVIDTLQAGDTVLISEGCTHHRQCGDIGSVKIPRWLKERTGKDLNIVTSSGTDFPEDLSPYSLIIHCGGCMLNEREMCSRMKRAAEQGIPMTNYGIAIAFMKGILPRSVAMLPDVRDLLH